MQDNGIPGAWAAVVLGYLEELGEDMFEDGSGHVGCIYNASLVCQGDLLPPPEIFTTTADTH